MIIRFNIQSDFEKKIDVFKNHFPNCIFKKDQNSFFTVVNNGNIIFAAKRGISEYDLNIYPKGLIFSNIYCLFLTRCRSFKMKPDNKLTNFNFPITNVIDYFKTTMENSGHCLNELALKRTSSFLWRNDIHVARKNYL